MLKSELIAQLAAKYPEYDLLQMAEIVDDILDNIVDALVHKNRVEIRDFGNWQVKCYDSCEARDPRTGSKVKVAPRYLPRFKMGKALRDHIMPLVES